MTDLRQQAIVEMYGKSALVLAGPGCGKTHILARRIFHAHSALGVPFGEMLCLTFTNRAAREMGIRIESYLGYKPEGLFTGNIHRFCLRFLLANELLPSDTAILDEEDRDAYFRDTLNLTHATDRRDFARIVQHVYQKDCGHPHELTRRLSHPVSDSDLAMVRQYEEYKRRLNLVDFDDIILRTYTALLSSDYRDFEYSRYSWVQVDEVQDMTPLQMAIVGRISSAHRLTALYLGDEQQAIFSFTGAGGVALDAIRRRCSGNILHLQKNYRSPGYLVDLCNDVASLWLGSPTEYLPEADSTLTPPADALSLIPASRDKLPLAIRAIARRFLQENPSETVAILTRTNAEADVMSDLLAATGISHIRLSKNDIFHSADFKTIYAHLAVTADPEAFSHWPRLLYQTRSMKTLSGAARLVDTLRSAAVSPREILAFDRPTDVEFFSSLIDDERETIVVLDTETSGLDVFTDDIVQIAAVKVCGGKIVEGSEFEVFIESDRQLPPMLRGGIANPLCATYRRARKLSPEEAFSLFADYCDGCTALAGHNLAFDLPVIANNIRRRTDLDLPQAFKSRYVDTLVLSRLLVPALHSHRLAAMIEHFAIEGRNSHNATDDVLATARLLIALKDLAIKKLPEQKAVRQSPSIAQIASRFTRNYGEIFRQARKRLLDHNPGPENSLGASIDDSYRIFLARGFIHPIRNTEYLRRLVDDVITGRETTFRNQLQAHLHDLLTYNESDLFTNNIVAERLSVMTVHKAKGLEMDNVIVYDASESFGTSEDHARVLYVAFSRARRRLAVGLSDTPDPIVHSVLSHFHRLTPAEIKALFYSELSAPKNN